SETNGKCLPRASKIANAPAAMIQYLMAKGLPTYWGEKPFTSGPWYFGAGVFFLFVLGLVIVRDRLKYWIIAAGALAILLALGKHFPLVSDLFLDYLPLYNKFRAVESILVVVSILIPILAV